MDIEPTRPRFRSDLIAQPIDDAGHHFVDVTDPDSGKTFRFYEVEYAIATAMDGQRNIDGLADWARSELELEPSPDELHQVIGALADLGYLDEEPMALDDLSLGNAGVPRSDMRGKMPMPAPADVQLGSAGNEDIDMLEEATFVAGGLALGQAGNEMSSGFPGVDEDDLPTMIKDSRRPQPPMRPSDPSIPPQPPDSLAPEPSLHPVRGAMEEDDGPTHLPEPAPDFDDDEMSVDLTDHMKLGPEALKEAVRQSQMIKVVNPDELFGNRKTPPPPPMPSILDESRKTPPPPPQPESADPRLATVQPQPTPDAQPGIKPMELPEHRALISQPVDVEDRPVVPPQPTSSRAGLLIVLLLLVLIGAAAAVYFLNLFDVRARLGLEKDQAASTAKTDAPKTGADSGKPDRPGKIEHAEAKLVLQEGEAIEVKATQKGELASIVESGTAVEEGDEIARYKGGENFEKNMAKTALRLEHYQEKLTAAQAKGVQRDIDRATRKVEEKQGAIDADKQKLEAFIVRSPMAGAIETALTANAKVAEGDVLAAFNKPSTLTAAFTLPKGRTVAQGDEVEVISKADDKKRLGCVVTTAEGQNISVSCPADEGLSADDDVVLP